MGLLVFAVICVVVGIITYAVAGSFWLGFIGAIVVTAMIGNTMIDIQGDWNRASQHKRDKEILNAIRDLKDDE